MNLDHQAHIPAELLPASNHSESSLAVPAALVGAEGQRRPLSTPSPVVVRIQPTAPAIVHVCRDRWFASAGLGRSRPQFRGLWSVGILSLEMSSCLSMPTSAFVLALSPR